MVAEPESSEDNHKKPCFVSHVGCTEVLGLFCTLSIVLYVEDKKYHNVLSSTYKTMDKVQNKPSSSVQHTPLSESFKVYPCRL
jgi:hypothetical protein